MVEHFPVFEFGEFRLDSAARCLIDRSNGESLPLTPRSFDLLLLLVVRANRLVSRQEIMQSVWQNVIVEDNSLDQVISTLRHALGEHRGEHRYIKTVHRRGYRFIMPVRAVTSPHVAPRSVKPATPPTPPSRRAAWWSLAGLSGIGLLVLGTLIATRSPTGVGVAPMAPRTLAVLPFEPLVASDRNESLEMGVAETLITTLRSSGLDVKSLSTVRRFAGDDREAVEIGRELGVEAVLEGFLQRDADRLRVSASLVRVADGAQIWHERYDEVFAGMLAVQDAIAAKVQSALAPATRDVSSDSHRSLTEDAEAYHLYLTARYHRDQRLNVESLRQALNHFGEAARRDPSFAAAHVGVAETLSLLCVFGALAPLDALPPAREALQRALALEPDSAAALTALGHVKTQLEHDWQGAEAAYLRALEVDPQYAPAHQLYGHWLAYAGRYDEAVQELRRAAELEPSVPQYRALIGLMLNYQRRYTEAVDMLQGALAVDDRLAQARTFLAQSLVGLARYDEALAQLDAGERLAPTRPGYRGQIYALSGDEAKAEAELQRLENLRASQYVSAYDIAAIHAVLGNGDDAMLWLQRAYEERAQAVSFLPWDPAFDEFSDDPRYLEVVKRLNVSHRR
jgi:DNA-binding winged helix-turn-helix (wHTH) protein/TolB-like protein/Flp pilus assembly protein TadD